MPLTKTEARKILLSLEGAREGLHFRQPAVFIGEEFLTRVHNKEDAVVILTGSIEMRDVMLEAEPKLFYITDHYRNFPALLARLSQLNTKTLKDLLAPRLKRIAEKTAKKPRKKAVTPAKRKIRPKK